MKIENQSCLFIACLCYDCIHFYVEMVREQLIRGLNPIENCCDMLCYNYL